MNHWLIILKVYTLSNPEQDFWEQMSDPTEGHIGIKIKGRNFEEIRELEADVAEGIIMDHVVWVILYDSYCMTH